LDKSQFDAESLERPALVRAGERLWRLYLSYATPGSKRWWIAVLEAGDPERLADSQARVAFTGDDRTGVKDPGDPRRARRLAPVGTAPGLVVPPAEGASGRMVALGTRPVSDARYLDVVALPQGRYRLFYEAPLADGSHELRTEVVAGTDGTSSRA
jgi:hypothetical protein